MATKKKATKKAATKKKAAAKKAPRKRKPAESKPAAPAETKVETAAEERARILVPHYLDTKTGEQVEAFQHTGPAVKMGKLPAIHVVRDGDFVVQDPKTGKVGRYDAATFAARFEKLED